VEKRIVGGPVILPFIMNRDPYTPSDAVMSSAPRPPKPRTPAPWTVSCGLCLYALSFVLYFVLISTMEPIADFVDVPPPDPDAPPESAVLSNPRASMLFGVVVVMTIFVLPAWLLFKVIRRRNWARIALTLGSIGVFALATPFLFEVLAHHPASASVFLGNAALEVISLVLLFTPTANEWFRSANDE
jgi:drug/metabolite transporter (DMT)-like permease